MSRVLALLALAAVALIGGLALTSGGDDGDRRRVHAEFRDASGLRPGSVVRVGGATVGAVEDLRITARDTAAVTLDIESEALPGAGARAAVRALNLLGEKFVDLDVGDRARPLPSARIPMSRTSTPVEIDDVLNVLDPATRDRLGLLLGEMGVALGNRGRDLSAVLQKLPPTLEDATGLLEQVGADTAVLERLLVEAERVSATVARERRPLSRLVRTGAEALAVPAARRDQLGATLRQVPGTLSQLRSTLGRLDRAGAALRPAARGLRATAPSLTSSLRALPGFDTAAAPALATLRDVSPWLTRLGREASPVVRRLRSTTASLSDLAGDADALTETLDEGAATDLLSVMQNWALAIQNRDGVGHLFRVALTLTPDTLRQLDAYLGDPPAKRRQTRRPKTERPARPSAPRGPDSVERPLERALGKGRLQRTLDEVTKPLDPVVEDVRRALDGLAGGPPQRQGADDDARPLLDFLLGP